MKTLKLNPVKAIPFLILFSLLISAFSLKSQNAPITTTGIITNATTSPGATVVPVTVKNFVSIGAFTLTIRYRLALATYVSASPHPSFPGISVTHSTSGLFGKLVITWPQTPGGVTLPDETHLVDLIFTYISGNCHLTWLFSGTGNVCKYQKYSNGSYVILNDLPKQSYYINGGFSNRAAPLTYLPLINNPSPGPLNVPVTVNDFDAVGANSLTIEYNGNVLEWDTCSKNPLLTGSFFSGVQPGLNGNMILTIAFTAGTSSTLPDGSTAYTIHFNYTTTNSSSSILNFSATGSSCEYADASAQPFFDSPGSSYYFNGAVYTQYAPKTWLPVMTEAIPSAAVSLPVYVDDFNNVRSFTLSFEYEGTMMTFTGFTPDPAFGSELIVTDEISGSKRKVVLSWLGTSDKTLPSGSLIANVDFIYISGTSPLTWITNDLVSCRFNDASGNAYFDWPKTLYYKDGIVASHVAPITVGGQQSAVIGQQVTVPVIVYDFSNIGLFGLTLDYDPSVLTYQGATLIAPIGGAFSASTAGQGRLMMNWSGTAVTLSDSAHLIDLTFIYNGGATTLAWCDLADSSRYKETPGGFSLYDSPQSKYYINGYVGPNPLIANFVASSTSGDLNTTITFTDQSTGGPTTWNWSISPSGYYFVNGTTASSQHPQVKFTTNGVYTVTLIIGRETTNAIRIRSDYLHIGTPGLWTGITSSGWNVPSNWHNYAVPVSSVNVLIPGSAPNWPNRDGDLAIGGSNCLSLTLQGAAQLTIGGDLTINTGSQLTFTGNGLLVLGGNWTNAGVFNCGSGTLDFTGTADATISSTASPETFYHLIVSKTGAEVSVPGNVHVIGLE